MNSCQLLASLLCTSTTKQQSNAFMIVNVWPLWPLLKGHSPFRKITQPAATPTAGGMAGIGSGSRFREAKLGLGRLRTSRRWPEFALKNVKICQNVLHPFTIETREIIQKSGARPLTNQVALMTDCVQFNNHMLLATSNMWQHVKATTKYRIILVSRVDA